MENNITAKLSTKIKDVCEVSIYAYKKGKSPYKIEKSLGLFDGYGDEVRETQKKSPIWGWCRIEVTVDFLQFFVFRQVDNCSYTSKEDFMQNSGIYEGMLDSAVEELISLMDETTIEQLLAISNLS